MCWDESERLVSDDLPGQFRQVLVNTLAILKEGGAGPENVVRMTWYNSDRDAYVAALPEIGALYRELMGRNYPTMAVVQVAALVEPAARIEIETTAVVLEGRCPFSLTICNEIGRANVCTPVTNTHRVCSLLLA